MGTFLFCAIGAAFGVEHVQAVGYGINNRQNILLGSLLAAGKRNDQCTPADTGDGAGKTALRSDPHRFCSHGLRNTGRGPLNDLHSCLGGDISGREAGAAGGQHQGDLLFVGALGKLCLDHLPVIGDDGGVGDEKGSPLYD